MVSNPYQQAIHRYCSQAVIHIGYLLIFCRDESQRKALLDARRTVLNIGRHLFSSFSD